MFTILATKIIILKIIDVVRRNKGIGLTLMMMMKETMVILLLLIE